MCATVQQVRADQLQQGAFCYRREEAKYDEYIRQGIEDLKANVLTDQYSFLLQNLDAALEQTTIGDGFHSVTMMILILLSYVLSLDREYLNSKTATLFEPNVEGLNSALQSQRWSSNPS